MHATLPDLYDVGTAVSVSSLVWVLWNGLDSGVCPWAATGRTRRNLGERSSAQSWVQSLKLSMFVLYSPDKVSALQRETFFPSKD